MWFTNSGNNSIGRVTTSGVVTNYTGTGINGPAGITAGPDGALWFTNLGDYRGDSIGRITTGGAVTTFTGEGILGPERITTGPDGALWFTNIENNTIGRITTAGVVTNYPGADGPFAITAGPGGVWFTNLATDSIGTVTTAGVLSNYADSTINYPAGIVISPDGAVWFAGEPNWIGRITSTGSITNYRVASSSNTITGLTVGPDGELWMVGSSTIWRIAVPPYVSVSPDSGPGGEDVTMSGGSFLPGEIVKAVYETGLSSPRSVMLCSSTASPAGQFTCNGEIPTGSDVGSLGNHEVIARGLTSGLKAKTSFELAS